MRRLVLPASLSLLALASAIPSLSTNKALPLLIWHGLGDSYDADGLHSVGDLAAEIHPNTYTYYICISDDGGEDRKATFLGNLTEHIEKVCEDIHSDPVLSSHGREVRVDALGFSQGGQFLRGLVQRCEGLSVRSLVTFGSQHNGIAEIKACGTWDFVCKGALALMRSNAWSEYVQSHVVPAQYYRTVNETTGEPVEGYLETSGFLADVNNEREEKKEVYKERIAQLEKLVMVVFAEDTTVIPKESGWFAEVNKTDGKVTELRDRRIYKEDWIGLKKLDAKGGLVFETTPGDHMQLDEDVLKETFRKYFGPERKLKMLSSGCVHGISVVASWWAWLWSWSPLAEQNIHSGL